MIRIYTVIYYCQSDTKDGSRKIIENAFSSAKEELKENNGISIEIDYSILGKSCVPSIF